MGGSLGIPRERLPIAVAMVIALAAALAFLQGRFDQSDVKKGIGIALAHRAEPGGPTVFDAIVKLGQGDPNCDGKVVSMLLGDVDVRCSTPGQPSVEYEFRVLLDGKRAPRAAIQFATLRRAGAIPTLAEARRPPARQRWK
ncbi:MAG: hypothetical protein E6J85_11220 [Deltaproteobacteria bacterium]|nr:MAG: hypothetical protein E6J85_11220 [Deltaproteobacteria bacterium]